jgi:hypothetical protein
MPPEIDAASVVDFHDRQLQERDWPMLSHAQPGAGLWQAIDANHRYNGLLWREEIRARRPGASADDVAAAKRLGDRYEVRRRDSIDAIDDALLAALARVPRLPGARLSSETAGAMLDRLSVLAIQGNHMRAWTARPDASEAQLHALSLNLACLAAQRSDLAACFDALLADAQAGRAWFKLYRQHRLTDEPAAAPWRHGRTPAPSQEQSQSQTSARSAP